jgi:hypothetical protein
MNRRQFFQRMGWGAGGLLLAPTVFGAAWSESWEAEDITAYAVACAREAGALYADARVGTCQLSSEGPHVADRAELLGMRICGPDGWRHVLLHSSDRDQLRAQIEEVLATPLRQDSTQRKHWIAAVFLVEQTLASASSDPSVATTLQTAWMRYPQPTALPASSADIFYCDLLLTQ